jgi:glycosyltransferase involved in cell wall biosynthesis
MKILVLSYEYPPIGGGGGVICKNISENLVKLGNKVTILTTALPAPGARHPAINNSRQSIFNDSQSSIINLNIIHLNALRKNAHESNPFEMLSWITKTKRYIKSNPGFIDFDICMAHFVLPGGEVARWLKKRYGLPYVLISHGHEIPWVHPGQMFLFHLAAYFWIKNVCRQSSANFIQTRMMKSNIDRFLGRRYHEKNIVIPNGVDTRSFYPDYSKRPNRLRIIFAGRLVIQKDPMTFLRAIKLFSGYTRDFEVHILGDGNLRNKL